MTELIELRVAERHAHLLFAPTEGTRLGDFVRKIVLPVTDPRIRDVARLQTDLRAQGESFFLGWDITRRYSARELDAAAVLSVLWTSTIEPCGEECGTIYDESNTCQVAFTQASTVHISGVPPVEFPADTCGVGSRIVGALRLNARSLPRRKDFARTIAGEWIVSARARHLLQEGRMSGPEFREIRDADDGPLPDWSQLTLVSEPAAVIAPTATGIAPFESESSASYICPLGHTFGLDRFSELYVAREQPESDAFTTLQMFGVRRGLLRPEPEILVSQRFRQLVLSHGLKGWRFEVAHVASVGKTD